MSPVHRQYIGHVLNYLKNPETEAFSFNFPKEIDELPFVIK
jgi:hypothetical protein